jgi:hypothetical protein
LQHSDKRYSICILQHLGHRYAYRRGDFATFRYRYAYRRVVFATFGTQKRQRGVFVTFRTQMRVQKRSLFNI